MNKELLAKMYEYNISSRSAYLHWLKCDLADCNSILELGCGSNSPILKIGYGKKTSAVDIWKPYIDMHNKRGDYKSCKLANILDMEFPYKAFDAVVITDVMEHLDKSTVKNIDLFSKMERSARKRVIIFAPNGYIENDEVDGDPYQAHVSAWHPADYKQRGYKVKGATGLRFLFGKASIPKRPQIITSIIGLLSQPLVYDIPALAWHSYAVKELR